jgi:hypothetical protein
MIRMRWLAVAVIATLVAVPLPASAATSVTQEVTGIATVGPTSVGYKTSSPLLLDHFYFRDVNDDQHLKVLEVLPSPNDRLALAFSDESRDEQFEYRVAHQRISPIGVTSGRVFRTGCHEYCVTKINVPAGDYVFVISGFSFLFADGDHHIDQIGIEELNGYVYQRFNDSDDNDEFSALVEYVWVPRSSFSFFEKLVATPGNRGQVTRDVAAGPKVIQGFNVQNVENNGTADNHIKRFGFLTHSTTVDIYYGDKDPTDSGYWSYRLWYAVLK